MNLLHNPKKLQKHKISQIKNEIIKGRKISGVHKEFTAKLNSNTHTKFH